VSGNQFSLFSIIEDEFLHSCEILGQGTYGLVFKAYDKSDPTKVVAIKRILKKSLVTEELEYQQYELNALKVIKEAYIKEVPRILDIFEDSSFISIVMEY